jgi:hypothetical protein
VDSAASIFREDEVRAEKQFSVYLKASLSLILEKQIDDKAFEV